MRKKINALIVCVLLICMIGGNTHSLADGIKVYHNNKLKTTSAINYKSRIYIPIKDMSTMLNRKIKWNSYNGIITIYGSKNDVINIHTKNNYYIKNNKKYSINVKPITINSKLYIPIKVYSDVFNKKISWDSKNKIVKVYDNAKIQNSNASKPKVIKENKYLLFEKKKISIGMSVDEIIKQLGSPERIDEMGDFKTYIYNAKASNYKGYIQLSVMGDRLKYAMTNSPYWVYYNDNKIAKTTDENGAILSIGDDIYRYMKSNNKKNKDIMEKISVEIAEITNVFRVNNSLKALEIDADLSSVAYGHSKDMAQTNYFNHKDKQGRGLSDRLNSNNISFTGYGENIAMNSDFNPRYMYEQWLNSPSHRKNMLGDEFDKIGLGVYDKNGIWATQCFIRK